MTSWRGALRLRSDHDCIVSRATTLKNLPNPIHLCFKPADPDRRVRVLILDHVSLIPLYNGGPTVSFSRGNVSVIRLFGCFLLAGLLGFFIDQSARADERPAPMSLWHTVSSPPTVDQPPAPRKPWVLRDREIALDLQLLQTLKDAAARPHPRVSVELFDGANHELDITSTVSRINDTAVIRGIFKPPSQGDFTFVASGNLLVGTMQMGTRLYKTEHIANGRLRLLEVDPNKMPPD